MTGLGSGADCWSGDVELDRAELVGRAQVAMTAADAVRRAVDRERMAESLVVWTELRDSYRRAGAVDAQVERWVAELEAGRWPNWRL